MESSWGRIIIDFLTPENNSIVMRYIFDVTTSIASLQTFSELSQLHSELQRGLDEVVALGPEQEALVLNDSYYLQVAYYQNDLDKMRVFKKLFVAFRTEMHLVESVIDIIREDLGYSEAAPVITETRVNAYRRVVDAFAGIEGIPVGAIMRAAVRAVEAPEEAKALAAQIRNKQFV